MTFMFWQFKIQAPVIKSRQNDISISVLMIHALFCPTLACWFYSFRVTSQALGLSYSANESILKTMGNHSHESTMNWKYNHNNRKYNITIHIYGIYCTCINNIYCINTRCLQNNKANQFSLLSTSMGMQQSIPSLDCNLCSILFFHKWIPKSCLGFNNATSGQWLHTVLNQGPLLLTWVNFNPSIV